MTFIQYYYYCSAQLTVRSATIHKKYATDYRVTCVFNKLQTSIHSYLFGKKKLLFSRWHITFDNYIHVWNNLPDCMYKQTKQIRQIL